jgi:hypothetical protein
VIKSEKRTAQERCIVDLQQHYRGKNKLLFAVMGNMMKPNTELCSILDKNRKFVWTEDTNLRTWVEYFIELLNG